MIVLCIDGIPSRGLHSGRTYEVLDSYNCSCGRPLHRLLAVKGAKGRLRPAYWHGYASPGTPTGWFLARRFIKVADDPQTQTRELEAA